MKKINKLNKILITVFVFLLMAFGVLATTTITDLKIETTDITVVGNLNVSNSTNTHMFVNSSTGFIGIGIDTPNIELDVNGTINATTDVCITGGSCLSNTISGSDWNRSGNNIYLNDTNNTVIIGRTTPLGRVTIQESGLAGELLHLKVLDANYVDEILRISSNSSTSRGLIRFDSPAPEIEFVETDQSAPDGKFEIRVNNNKFQINSRNTLDNSFEKNFGISSLVDDGGNIQFANPYIGKYHDWGYARFSIFNKSQGTTNYFAISTNTIPANTADGTGVPIGDIFLIDGDGKVGIGTGSPTEKLSIESATDSNILLQTSGSSDPSIIFNTTNSYNKIKFYLDESETNNHFYMDGRDSIDLDTYFSIRAERGENAYITIGQNNTNLGSLLYSSGNIMRVRNHLANQDIRFTIHDGVTSQVDLLSIDASTKRVGIGDTSPSHMLQVAGDVNLNDSLYVLNSGNVGIGTDTPQQELNVIGDGNFTGKLIIGDTTAQKNITLYSPDGTEFTCGVANDGTFSCN